ncbi:glycosyltransferase family 2 protein [Fodinibius sediminis]|uniref:Glycosyltransferase, catalytic subunit of cellulose synthase and poly-beta-1,6-N-acetylglucosamine synthase n=1 Tax=Fodinibius sediminis TaxID=1214077 RepID=A0A521D9C8_9BACT|nr:glycosyltransferase [Fodinibius sediminis]SMO68309.1 Glycosyltransferase, catalytic subunit of cellulose synthase and poly-beta-1,6-N-acetylglucosamine synthase [Fodinibius sediminis]
MDDWSIRGIAEWTIIGYFLIFNSTYLLLVISALVHVRKQLFHSDIVQSFGLFKTNFYRRISILVPAYNESGNIIESVESLLKLHYPDYEVIVINDGSSDATMEQLISHFDLQETELFYEESVDHKTVRAIYKSPELSPLTVIDKENGGKADALNAGLNVSDSDLICSIDADSLLEVDVLQKLIRTFIQHKDTIAAGGIVRVVNGCKMKNREIQQIHVPKSFLGRLQSVEYLRSFLFGRVGWDYLNSLLIVSGAFGIFKRTAVQEVGGYLPDTVGEDIELIIRLHSHYQERNTDYKIRFLPEPICWTEVPDDYTSLKNQRNRWHRGLADAIWRHRKMLFNPTYGYIGMFILPFFLFFELLGPIVRVGGYGYLAMQFFTPGALDTSFVILFLSASIIYGMIVSLISVLAEELTFKTYSSYKDILVLILYSFLENLGYRQVHAWWQLLGLFDFLKGKKSWGKINRRGFKDNNA